MKAELAARFPAPEEPMARAVWEELPEAAAADLVAPSPEPQERLGQRVADLH